MCDGGPDDTQRGRLSPSEMSACSARLGPRPWFPSVNSYLKRLHLVVADEALTMLQRYAREGRFADSSEYAPYAVFVGSCEPRTGEYAKSLGIEMIVTMIR